MKATTDEDFTKHNYNHNWTETQLSIAYERLLQERNLSRVNLHDGLYD